jgi:hypothetical protein
LSAFLASTLASSGAKASGIPCLTRREANWDSESLVCVIGRLRRVVSFEAIYTKYGEQGSVGENRMQSGTDQVIREKFRANYEWVGVVALGRYQRVGTNLRNVVFGGHRELAIASGGDDCIFLADTLHSQEILCMVVNE